MSPRLPGAEGLRRTLGKVDVEGREMENRIFNVLGPGGKLFPGTPL